MSRKKMTIDYELEFLDKKIKELERYIDERPTHKLKDRVAFPDTKYTKVITIEDQRKDVTSAMKEYSELVRAVKALRDEEEKRIETLGKTELGAQASRWAKTNIE